MLKLYMPVLYFTAVFFFLLFLQDLSYLECGTLFSCQHISEVWSRPIAKKRTRHFAHTLPIFYRFKKCKIWSQLPTAFQSPSFRNGAIYLKSKRTENGIVWSTDHIHLRTMAGWGWKICRTHSNSAIIYCATVLTFGTLVRYKSGGVGHAIKDFLRVAVQCSANCHFCWFVIVRQTCVKNLLFCFCRF